MNKPTISKTKRAAVWNKTDGICWYCGYQCHPFTDFTIDHIKAIINGGTDDIDNLVPCCKPCNSRKHSRGVEWLRGHIEREGVSFSNKQIDWLKKHGIEMPDLPRHKFWYEEQGLE